MGPNQDAGPGGLYVYGGSNIPANTLAPVLPEYSLPPSILWACLNLLKCDCRLALLPPFPGSGMMAANTLAPVLLEPNLPTSPPPSTLAVA